MKKLILITQIIITMAVSGGYAQQILGITIQPVNPTTTDMIHVYVDLEFPSGGCSDKTQQMVQSGNSFYAYALHCNGQLAFICNTTDTFMINPLPTGTYTFRFGVDAGQGPSPCTPGIVPGPDDSIQFTVNTTTSINTPSPTTPEIYLDAAADLLNVGLMSSGFSDLSIDIYNVLGKKIITKKIIENKSRINVSTLPDGVYIVKIYGNGIHHTGRFLKRN